GSRTNHAADVRRDHHDVLDVVVLLDVAGQDRHRVEIVGRNVEEALDLAGMQVEGEHPVGAGFGDQVGDEFGGDRCARACLAVLSGIAEIGKNRGDAFGGRAPERIDHDQQFHQVVIGRERGRLDDEDILAADVFLDLYENFLVRKASYAGFSDWNIEVVTDGVGEMQIGR